MIDLLLKVILTVSNFSCDRFVTKGYPYCFHLQLHIVHMKDKYSSLTDALKDPTGVAVLGFFYEVSLHIFFFFSVNLG